MLISIKQMSETVVYTNISDIVITDSIIVECATTFSTYYGIWSTKGIKPGCHITMSPKKFRDTLLFDPKTCGICIACIDGKLVGHAVYCKFIDQKYGKVCWITQLVVDSAHRHIGIATNLIHMSYESTCDTCGLCSSHPYAIKALQRASKSVCDCVPDHNSLLHLINNIPIPYIKGCPLVSGKCCLIDTKFHIDHSYVTQLIEDEKADSKHKWCLGNLLEGHEFLAIVHRT